MPPKRGRRSSPVAGPSMPTKRPRPEPASSEAAQDVSALSVLAPSTLELYLPRAKREVLRVLAGGLPPTAHRDGRECLGLEEQYASVRSALDGTVNAGEGNSVLLVSARGSGKSLVLESALRGLDGKKEPHVVRLDAALQYTDRLSMRELARQLIRLGALRLPKTQEEEAALGLVKDDEDEAAEIAQQEGEREGQEGQEAGRVDDGEDGKEDEEKEAMAGAVLSSLANTTSTILSLLSNGANDAGTDARPLVIVLSSFELYTTRPRQALLYVLFDAVQAGSYAPGLAVVGLTSRLGVTDLLEKRVRSRFSGRVVNFMPRMDLAAKAVEQALRAGTLDEAGEEAKTFNEAWAKEVDRVKEAELDDWEGLDELVELTSIRDVYNSILPKIAKLSPSKLSLVSLLSTSFDPPPAPDRIILRSLTSLEFALLVSARHLQIKGRETTFNFEMLLWQLKSFVARLDRDRQGLLASAAPGQAAVAASPEGLQTRRKNWATTGGVSSGFADRTRAMMAFRNLISLELFLPEHTISSSGRTTAKRSPLPRSEFVYVRLAIFPTDIVNSVNDDVERRDTLGTSLVQWARSAG